LEDIIKKIQDEKLTYEYEGISLKEKVSKMLCEHSENIVKLEKTIAEREGRITFMNKKINDLENSCSKKDEVVDKVKKENEDLKTKHKILEDFRNQIFSTVKEHSINFRSDSDYITKHVNDMKKLSTPQGNGESVSPSKRHGSNEPTIKSSKDLGGHSDESFDPLNRDNFGGKRGFLKKRGISVGIDDVVAPANDENQSSLSQTSH